MAGGRAGPGRLGHHDGLSEHARDLRCGTGVPNTGKAGDRLTITYRPARNGKPLGFGRSIVVADQREIEISSGSSAD